jgi:hypothetical protein
MFILCADFSVTVNPVVAVINYVVLRQQLMTMANKSLSLPFICARIEPFMQLNILIDKAYAGPDG